MRKSTKKASDRISNLPDDVLDSILGLLPKKCVMRTSILSKRWTNLWKSTWSHATSFDFGKEFAQAQTQQQFAITVNKYLHLHNGHKINKFRLYFSPSEKYEADLEKWIVFATSKGVKELDLTLPWIKESSLMQIPAILISCSSFINLSLSCISFSSPSGFTGFGSLQTLLLNEVSIKDEVLESLISNCPSLTNLCLRSCSSLTFIQVSSLSLKCFNFIVTNAYSIEIFAPNLKSLHFYGDILNGYDAYEYLNVNALEDFFISANGYDCTQPEHDFIKIISGVSHVKVLTICLGAPVFTTLAERCNLGQLPIALPNLEELQILVGGPIREEYLGCLFNFFSHIVCPSLDKIFIDLSGSYTPPPQDVEPAEEPLSCVFSDLKTIKINQFRGTGPEIEMVKFFLQRACTLELMVLVAASESPPVEDTSIVRDGGRTLHSEKSMKPLLDELVVLPKSSSDVQILLFDHGEVDTSLSPVHKHIDYYVDDILCT
ncbi:hypothetical protein ACHQM5_000568 [Ranunculus cassubicifolius]